MSKGYIQRYLDSKTTKGSLLYVAFSGDASASCWHHNPSLLVCPKTSPGDPIKFNCYHITGGRSHWSFQEQQIFHADPTWTFAYPSECPNVFFLARILVAEFKEGFYLQPFFDGMKIRNEDPDWGLLDWMREVLALMGTSGILMEGSIWDWERIHKEGVNYMIRKKGTQGRWIREDRLHWGIQRTPTWDMRNQVELMG